jgi:hypothetical protein
MSLETCIGTYAPLDRSGWFVQVGTEAFGDRVGLGSR